MQRPGQRVSGLLFQFPHETEQKQSLSRSDPLYLGDSKILDVRPLFKVSVNFATLLAPIRASL